MIYSLRMKKNILLVLLSAALLSSCEFDITLQRFFSKKDDKSGQQQPEGENNQNSQENPGENNNSNGNNGQQNSPQDIPENGYTATILTSGSSFASKFSVNSHFDTEKKQEELKSFLSSQLQYSGLIDTISCTNLHVQSFDNETYLQFGSGTGVGGLAITSQVKIYKVQVKVLCYAKYDDYHGITNIDSWSHFFINDEEKDLTYDGKTNPSVVTFEKSFESGVDTFTLASQYGRVYLKEMSVTWGNK